MLILIFVLIAVDVVFLTAINYGQVKDSTWYYVFSICLGNGLTLLWWWGFHTVDKEPRSTFLLGLAWDGVLTFVGTITPVLLYGVRVNKLATLGGILVIAGIILLKLSHEAPSASSSQLVQTKEGPP